MTELEATQECEAIRNSDSRDARIAELEAKIRDIGHRMTRQADVSDYYSRNSRDQATWRVCNSYFRDMATELLEAVSETKLED